RVLRRRVPVAGAGVGRGFRAEVALFPFQLANLGHETLAESGMGRQSLVVVRDLPAEILLLHLDQCFGVLPLEARDEQSDETAKEIRDPSPHSRCRLLLCVPKCISGRVAMPPAGWP